MKKLSIALALLLLCLSLAGCNDPLYKVRNVYWAGETYVVDVENCTIKNGDYTYRYSIDYSGTHVTYPNGVVYTWQQSGNVGYGTMSLDADISAYADLFTLVDVIEEATGSSKKSGESHAGAGILFILIGAFNAIWPEKSWYLSYGWRYKNAEPSDLAIGLGRVGGVICAIIGVFLLFA